MMLWNNILSDWFLDIRNHYYQEACRFRAISISLRPFNNQWTKYGLCLNLLMRFKIASVGSFSLCRFQSTFFDWSLPPRVSFFLRICFRSLLCTLNNRDTRYYIQTFHTLDHRRRRLRKRNTRKTERKTEIEKMKGRRTNKRLPRTWNGRRPQLVCKKSHF